MSEEKDLVTLTINDRTVSVPKGSTVYHAAQKLGIDVPIFCYHDRMPPFGACRVCLVEVEKSGKLQASCTLEAKEGMVIHTESAVAEDGRKAILEFLLINHPLDCPICDKGGECPLQNETMHHGPGESRFYEEKHVAEKALPLGPVLVLDRERCIVCARCTRFGDEIAGDHALEFAERGYKTEIATPGNKPVDSKFIGNTISICPVGALTSQVYRFRARPWDNRHNDSSCTLCPVGCSMTLDERDGEIVRTRSCENRDVNDVWLCDKGWFGYEFFTHPDRLQQPLIRRNGKLEAASWDEAINLVADQLKQAKNSGQIAAWGGDPLTVEENYLFQQLMREGLGSNHVDHRVGEPIFPLGEEGVASGMEMSIGECEELSYAVLFGVDLTEELPVIWLRLRQAINRGAKVVFIGNYAPEISPYLSEVILHAPGEEIATIKERLPAILKASEGKKGALFVGRQYLAVPHRAAILSELQQYRQSNTNTTLNILEGHGNSLGARFAGMHPECGPCGERLATPGLNTLQVLEKASQSGWQAVYVAGANPAKKVPAHLWAKARKGIKFLVVQDLFLTETAQEADVVLPALCYVEKRGSFINIEGRVQKLQPGKDVPQDIYSDGELFSMIAQKLGISLTLDTHIVELLKAQRRVPLRQQQKNGTPPVAIPPAGDLMAVFAPALFDNGVRMNHNEHLKEVVKEPKIRMNFAEASKRGIGKGSRIKVVSKQGSIVGEVQLDNKVANKTVVIPEGFSEIAAHELSLNLLNGISIEIEH